jgi:hypothetical protein
MLESHALQYHDGANERTNRRNMLEGEGAVDIPQFQFPDSDHRRFLRWALASKAHPDHGHGTMLNLVSILLP